MKGYVTTMDVTYWNNAKYVGICFVICLLLLPVYPAGANQADATDQEGVNVADDSPLEKVVEVGGEYGSYSNGYGDANSQFLRFSLTRPSTYTWRVETGRVKRFNDTGFGYGLSYTRYFKDGLSFLIGVSSGTGEFIFPDYRIDLAVGRAFLAQDNLIATLGYTHIRSKSENRSNGVGLELTWYVNDHWILGAFGRQEYGHPGSTTSTSGGMGITYLIYKKFYLGGAVEFGDISYLLVGPGTALVDYNSVAYKLYSTYYVTPSAGFNLRLDYEDTDFYDMHGFSFSVFKEW
jgi:YaiO family outer membrane protein